MVGALLLMIGMPGGLLLVLATLLDLHGLRRAPAGPYDAIVVAGCRVQSDGSASGALRRRAQAGAKLYLAGLAPKLVLTGGPEPGRLAEAEVAAEICAALGVPEQALVREVESRNTMENAAFAARLVSGRVLVVSDTYHTWRCRRVFGKHFDGVETSGTKPALRSRIRHALREVSSITAHYWRGDL